MIEMALTLEVALKALFLLLLTYALAWGYRRRSAAERHRIWSLGLASTLVLPVLVRYLPSIDLHFLPHSMFSMKIFFHIDSKYEY